MRAYGVVLYADRHNNRREMLSAKDWLALTSLHCKRSGVSFWGSNKIVLLLLAAGQALLFFNW